MSMEFYLNVISKKKEKQKCFHCLLLFKWLYSTEDIHYGTKLKQKRNTIFFLK